MITSCKINKIPNKCGNYSCQYIENGKFIITANTIQIAKTIINERIENNVN